MLLTDITEKTKGFGSIELQLLNNFFKVSWEFLQESLATVDDEEVICDLRDEARHHLHFGFDKGEDSVYYSAYVAGAVSAVVDLCFRTLLDKKKNEKAASFKNGLEPNEKERIIQFLKKVQGQGGSTSQELASFLGWDKSEIDRHIDLGEKNDLLYSFEIGSKAFYYIAPEGEKFYNPEPDNVRVFRNWFLDGNLLEQYDNQYYNIEEMAAFYKPNYTNNKLLLQCLTSPDGALQ